MAKETKSLWLVLARSVLLFFNIRSKSTATLRGLHGQVALGLRRQPPRTYEGTAAYMSRGHVAVWGHEKEVEVVRSIDSPTPHIVSCYSVVPTASGDSALGLTPRAEDGRRR